VNPHNARKHGVAQIAQLESSFSRFGQVWPLLVNEDGTLIAGHGRLEAAKLCGLGEIRVIVARDWTEDQCRSFALLDNRVALNAEWDEAALMREFAHVMSNGEDLQQLGFDERELLKLISKNKKKDTGPKLDEMSYSVVIRCDSEEQQLELLARFGQEGLTCEALIS
jgi:ParB-like chromosome segregation protein Spo0J